MEEGELFQNKYRIGKLLGEGAMGVVYAATQELSGMQVAIKFVSAKNVSARRLNAERLVREAKALARLSHGNLVRLYDFDKTLAGDYFMVMELVEGSPLHGVIRRARKEGKNLDPLQVLHVMAQVAEGMAAAHDAGVIHRDLKPENIIVSAGRLVRIIDFGLAKNPAGGAALPKGAETNPAHVVGTPSYMAPEQVSGGEIDARTDIFAIGVTMYEALTNRLPFEREDDEDLGVTEVFARQCCAEATPLRSHVPGVSERVAMIVLRCLAKEPADRYQTARELARDLRAALVDEVKAQQQREQHAPAPGDVRETAPVPPEWTPRAVLPFAPSDSAPGAPPATHVVRETVPMAPPGSGGPPQPTYAAAQPVVHRGVGYTTKMQRPSAAALATAEEEVARERSAASPVPRSDAVPSVAPSSGPVARDADAHRAADRPSRPSPASASGVHPRQNQSVHGEAAGTNASSNRGNESHPMPSQRPVESAAAPQQPAATVGASRAMESFAPPHVPLPASPAPRPSRGAPPLYVAPVVGTALAAAALVAVMVLRAPKTNDAPRGMPTNTGAAVIPPVPPSPSPARPDTSSTVAAPTAAPTSPEPIAAPAPSSTGTGGPAPALAPGATGTATATGPRAIPRGPLQQPSARPSEPRGAELPQPASRKRVETPPQPATTAVPSKGRLFGDDR